MNDIDANNNLTDETTQLTPAQKRELMRKYQRLLNLIPHGKHKKQRGTKGAFGKKKSERQRAK